MKLLVLTLTLAVAVLVLLVVLLKTRLRPRLKPKRFILHWQALQKLCGDKSTWPDAILEADKLLGDALKKRHYRGKRIGERLVAAQEIFTNKDGVWFGHNLAKKVVEEHGELKLTQEEVKSALLGIRQALKDLGAFGRDQAEQS